MAMGRAVRWLKKLLSGKKQASGEPKERPSSEAAREKTRWSFVRHRKSGAGGAPAAAEPSQVRPCLCGAGRREAQAAVVIQKAFRGFLARKALRALKSLVKLQALVRGFLVRKQAATTLHRLQALMRLQASSYALKKASSRKSVEQERIKQAVRPAHRRRLSEDSGFDRSPRIVEMDTCQMRSLSSRMTGLYAADLPGSLPGLVPWSSPLLYKPSSRLSIRRGRDHDSRQSKTAHNTPRFGGLPSSDSPMTPTKSVGAVDGLMRRLSCREGSPRYMADTASSAAKTRCQSVPRQRRAVPVDAPAEPRPSLTRAGSRKSCSQAQDSFSFKSSEVCRMDISEPSDEATRDYYLDRLW